MLPPGPKQVRESWGLLSACRLTTYWSWVGSTLLLLKPAGFNAMDL